MEKLFFTGGGLFLFLWSLVNFYVDISRYGLDSGIYWWFCNLALFGIGLGLLLRSRGTLTGFLAIAIFTQIFWLIDTIAHQSLGHGFFGLVDFRYAAGYPLDKFILGHYHYFPIPVALVALFLLPQYKNNTMKLITFFNPFIFGVSYFAFSANQNINCIHHACFPGLEATWTGPLYSFGFWGVIFGMHLVLGKLIDGFFLNLKITRVLQMRALTVLLATGLVTVGIIVRDTQQKLNLPVFSCAEPAVDRGVEVGCHYTSVMPQSQTLLAFYLKNRTEEGRFCRVKLILGEREQVLTTGAPVEPGSELKLNGIFENPAESLTGRLAADCSPMPNRVTASEN